MSPLNHDLLQRTAAYVRVSTDEQKLRGLSPEAQRDTLRRYAAENNLVIVEWYEDLGVSGRKPIKKRPELQRMIKDAEGGLFDRIIFIKLDRYFRSVAEYYECQKRLEAKNVLWTATEEKYDLTTASGRYWVTQKLAMAEYEADQTGERIDLVNEYKVRTGQPLTGERSLGLAYSIERDDDGIKRVVQDPKTKDMIYDYIDYFLIHHNKRQAYLYIKDKYDHDVSYRSLGTVLKDSKIYGHYRGNDYYCKPYVDKATFDRIQDILKKNIKKTAANRIYLFTGLIRCPECGRSLGGKYVSMSTASNPYAPEKIYRYKKDYYTYRCNKHAINKTCDFNKQINEMRIEKYLIDNLDSLVNEYVEIVKVENAQERNDNCVKKKIKELKSEMTRVNNMYRKNRMTDEEYDREYAELEERLKELESHLEPFKERDLTLYYGLSKSDWRAIYDALNKENKRAFWRKYIKQIILNMDGTVKRVIFF